MTIEYELASMRERILAWLLDLFVVGFGYILLYQLARMVFGSLWDNGWSVFWMVMMFLVYFLYNIFMEILNSGQSLGKMGLSIRVVRLDGKDPEWSDVVLRSMLQLVDSLFLLWYHRHPAHQNNPQMPTTGRYGSQHDRHQNPSE